MSRIVIGGFNEIKHINSTLTQLHRCNGFPTVQTVFSIPLHQPKPSLTGKFLHFLIKKKTPFSMLLNFLNYRKTRSVILHVIAYTHLCLHKPSVRAKTHIYTHTNTHIAYTHTHTCVCVCVCVFTSFISKTISITKTKTYLMCIYYLMCIITTTFRKYIWTIY